MNERKMTYREDSWVIGVGGKLEKEWGYLELQCMYEIDKENFQYILHIKKQHELRKWWHVPLIPALGKQRQADL